MEVRLRATANFDYEQVAACNISISVVDSQEIFQGNGLKLSSYSDYSGKLIFSHETGFQELGFRTLTRLGNQLITINIIKVNKKKGKSNIQSHNCSDSLYHPSFAVTTIWPS